jgi:hypothetical protein
MKKLFILLSVFILWTTSLSLPCLHAQTTIDQGTCGDNLTWIYTSDSTLTISGQGAMYDFYTAPWNAHKTTIKRAIILDSVTSIGGGGFSGCNKLTFIIIPNSVISIGEAAFYSCSTLTSVIIPNSVTTIGSSAFHHCYSLTSVTIGNSVTTIGDYAFSDCYSLSSVVIPNSVIAIRMHAFAACDLLASVTIPNSVTTIGDFAFFLCRSLNFIRCESIIPPSISENTFEDVPDTIPVFVPCNAIDTYQIANNWNVFTDFRGMLDTTFIFDMVCQGKPYTDSGFTIHTGEGIYYRTAVTSNNCDSVICLTLSEYPFVPTTDYFVTICKGDTYSDHIFTNLTQTGDYYDTMQSISGCDSIIKLTLTVNPIYLTSKLVEICQGDTYIFFEKILTEQGIYYDTMQTMYECDSIFELHLIVNPVHFVSDTAIINQGETYNFNGKILSEQGVYYDTLQTVSGCDSIFELYLTYETSIVERQLPNIKIYPNPTSGELRITNYELQTIENVEIYDVTGKQLPLPLERAGGEVIIDISHLPSSIYFLKVNRKTVKIIKN